jgi:hypothetical protein
LYGLEVVADEELPTRVLAERGNTGRGEAEVSVLANELSSPGNTLLASSELGSD